MSTTEELLAQVHAMVERRTGARFGGSRVLSEYSCTDNQPGRVDGELRCCGWWWDPIPFKGQVPGADPERTERMRREWMKDLQAMGYKPGIDRFGCLAMYKPLPRAH